MADHTENRTGVLEALREELVGPCPRGEVIDVSTDIKFSDSISSYGPWRQPDGEEILLRDRPFKRYGIGVLYPIGTRAEKDPAEAVDTEADALVELPDEEETEVLSESAAKDLVRAAQVAEDASSFRLDADSDDFDLTQANEYRPSTMAISFLLQGGQDAELEVHVTGGRYRRKKVSVAEKGSSEREFTWWLRSPVSLDFRFTCEELVTGARRRIKARPTAQVEGDLDLEVSVFARPRPEGRSLVTLSVTNRTASGGDSDDERALFQCWFQATVKPAASIACILPYPSAEQALATDEEQASFDLLYRDVPVFAVGHGCAADWVDVSPDKVYAVSAECLPSYQTPSITPVLKRKDGTPVEIPMAPLAGLTEGDDGWDSVLDLLALYEEWLGEQRDRVGSLRPEQREVAERHLGTCERVLERMRSGASFIRSDARAKRAFQLANHAMLLQQVRARPTARVLDWDTKGNRAVFVEGAPSGEWRKAGGKGSWRPFQIGFLLLAAESTASGDSIDREVVELIWFPTGGGKTEAYLGLAAFSLFLRRLKDPSDDGVGVLMRYTLRLLTAQQFQRAASLICAMEHLRQSNKSELGASQFSIGIWVGAASTPNNRAEGRRLLRKLVRGERNAENKFALLRCPWCAAQMGPFSASGKTSRSTPKVAGYRESEGTVQLECPDPSCFFSDELPVYVIDEDVYEARPSLVIGTVDKFATLAWNPLARALFGLDDDGQRAHSPPGLIIQDELHLISGPLGSLVGLYEAVIEELCTDRRDGQVSKPKIVGSTATIRRYEDQVRALYGRVRTELFPPRALDAGDSFFARYARDPNGNLLPGRLYVGVHGGGLGSVQTAQVRTFAALLQAPVPLSPDERDPWWTLVVFFNSLRELGTSLSLLQSDIPDYLKVVKNRLGLHPKDVRRLRRILELTGRMRSDEVPMAIENLSVPATESSSVDVSIASNIMEVGIDIDRLSLMTVVGQPKTTSQYIQVTGRIGRQWQERPGLIVTIYSPSKPRDRSHFEKFRSYHERLYAQVEPTSVTPFSPPVLQRALHAAMVSYVRQAGPSGVGPYPPPEELLSQLRLLLRQRVTVVDKEELPSYESAFGERLDEWLVWQRTVWSGDSSGDIPLLRRAGEYASRAAALLSWATPTSMRNVDAECQAEITRLYILDQGGDGSA